MSARDQGGCLECVLRLIRVFFSRLGEKGFDKLGSAGVEFGQGHGAQTEKERYAHHESLSRIPLFTEHFLESRADRERVWGQTP